MMIDHDLNALIADIEANPPLSHREYRMLERLIDYKKLLAAIRIAQVSHTLSPQAFHRVTATDEMWSEYLHHGIKNAARDAVPFIAEEMAVKIRPNPNNPDEKMIDYGVMIVPLTKAMRDERARLSSDREHVRKEASRPWEENIKPISGGGVRPSVGDSHLQSYLRGGEMAGDSEARVRRPNTDDPAAA